MTHCHILKNYITRPACVHRVSLHLAFKTGPTSSITEVCGQPGLSRDANIRFQHTRRREWSRILEIMQPRDTHALTHPSKFPGRPGPQVATRLFSKHRVFVSARPRDDSRVFRDRFQAGRPAGRYVDSFLY